MQLDCWLTSCQFFVYMHYMHGTSVHWNAGELRELFVHSQHLSTQRPAAMMMEKRLEKSYAQDAAMKQMEWMKQMKQRLVLCLSHLYISFHSFHPNFPGEDMTSNKWSLFGASRRVTRISNLRLGTAGTADRTMADACFPEVCLKNGEVLWTKIVAQKSDEIQRPRSPFEKYSELSLWELHPREALLCCSRNKKVSSSLAFFSSAFSEVCSVIACINVRIINQHKTIKHMKSHLKATTAEPDRIQW